MRDRTSILRRIRLAAPIVVGAAFVASTRVGALGPELGMPAIAALLALAAIAAALGGASAAGGRLRDRVRGAVTPLALVGSGGTFLLIVGSTPAKYVVAAAVSLLLGAYLSYVGGVREARDRYAAEDLAHLTFAVHAVSVFFFHAFAFGLGEYAQVPLPAMAAAAGAFTGIVAAEALSLGLVERIKGLSLAFALVGAEVFMALGSLPTSNVVNAAVAVIIFSAGLWGVRELLSAPGKRPALRRHFALSLSLIVLVLFTARWN